MAANFVGVLKQEWYAEDSKALANQIKEHESTLRLKRRWLMDLPLSEKEQKRIEDLLPPNDKIMPESFVRKDDVGYEDIKTCIEMAFRAHKIREKLICVQDDVTALNLCGDFQEISFLLDAMNNKGLCSFARILTGGLIIFEKTNLSMKRTIRELLPKVIAEKNDISKSKLTECSLLLKDPTNFHGNQMVHFTASESYHAAALKVLDGLEDFPSSTLRAMNRKLKGVKVYIPPLQPPKSGQNRGNLVNVVRKRCMKMLSCIGTVDEPAEQLARALGVAGLTLKLIMNRPDVRNFRRFSPEMEALHNDIAKAIHLLNDPKKVSLIELNKVQLLLDSKASVRGLRTAVRNLLIEYLYECSDMDNVPDFLIETIDIINRRAQLRSCKKSSSSNGFSSPKELMKEDIEKETQHVLNISAQAREVVANLLPEHEFDEEFANAYMEDFDGSDTLCVFYVDQEMEDGCQHFEFRSYTSSDQTESIGEINPVEFNSPLSSKRDGCLNVFLKGRSDMDLESMHLSPVLNNQCLGKEYPPGCRVEELGLAYSHSMKVTAKPSMSPPSHSPARKSCHNGLKTEETTSCSPATTKNGLSDFKVEEADIVHQQSRSVNQYLALQDGCDITSMAAYRFVGYMLDTLAKTEGLELYQGDRLYLKGYTSVPEDTEEASDTLASKFSEMWKIVLEH